MTDTATFGLTLHSDDVDATDVIRTWQYIKRLLDEIARSITGIDRASVHWKVEDDPTITLTASVNGVSKEQLDQIVYTAAEGLVLGSSTGHFPQAFDSEAVRTAQNILRLLSRIESISVYADNYGETEIATAHVEGNLLGHPLQRRIYSVVEGRLKMISSYGQKYRASIKDRFTDARVTFTFDDVLLEQIKGLFDKRVVAEGVIVYRADGTPSRFTSISSVRERKPTVRLRDYVGIAPSLTGGMPPEEYLEMLHGDGERSS